MTVLKVLATTVELDNAVCFDVVDDNVTKLVALSDATVVVVKKEMALSSLVSKLSVVHFVVSTVLSIVYVLPVSYVEEVVVSSA